MTDRYDLSPRKFAQQIGLTPPKDGHGALSFHGLLTLSLNRYYDRNTHLSRPLRLNT